MKPSKIQPISQEDFKKIIDHTKKDNYKLLWNVLYFSGLKIKLALDLKKSQIFLPNGEIRSKIIIYNLQRKEELLEIERKVFRISICFFLREAIKKYSSAEEESIYLIEGLFKNKPLSYRAALNNFKNSLRAASLEKKGLSLKSFRYSFALRLWQSGFSLSEIEKLLGLKSPKQIKNYLPPLEDRFESLLNQI